MAEVIRGKLVWVKPRSGEPVRNVNRLAGKPPKEQMFRVPLGQLDARLEVDSTDGIEVDLELDVKGRMIRIRPAGEAWQGAATVPAPPQLEGGSQRRSGYQQRGQQGVPNPQIAQGEFHNPYNFIPTPSREKVTNELGDREPYGHHRYLPGMFSGWIDVTVETKTPLLIPDTSRPDVLESGHKIFRTLRGPDGRPYPHPAGIRGALRSAYEAVTNSRYGVFQKHDAPHGYRMTAREGLGLVPARIEGGQIILLSGTKAIGATGPLYAAWLPCYSVTSTSLSSSWPALIEHGKCVWAYIEQRPHGRFDYWKVLDLRDGSLPKPTTATGRGVWVRGWICLNRKNIKNKHDERVFFTTNATPPSIPISDRIKTKWCHLILNYQTIHAEEIRSGKLGPPAMPGAAWSRHIIGGERERNLSDGTLCYADVEWNGTSLDLYGLFPVNISRNIHPDSPEDLLNDSLKPASRLDELSPADRVFGWVNQKGSGAYRGQLRIESVRCDPDAIEEFDGEGVPLAILGAPKSQQVRFYVGDRNGKPLPDGTDRPRYMTNNALRGRKVYLRDAQLPSGYWDNPTEDRTRLDRAVPGRYQEYRKPSGENERDDQNRSMRDWVKVGARFTFRLRVRNLSDVELGALLWLLTLPEDHHLRFGGGKPLGFGCVHLSINGFRLRSGKQIKDDYENAFDKDTSATRSVYPNEAESVPDGGVRVCDLTGAYEKAVSDAYHKPFEQVTFIEAFRAAAKGTRLPVHYPRRQRNPHPEGKNFEWFVQNERSGKRSLPPLVPEGGLPYYLW